MGLFVERDSLGRPKGALPAILIAWGTAVGALVVGGLQAGRVPALKVIGIGVGLSAYLLVALAIIWVRPRSRGEVEAGARLLRIAPWRRVLAVLLLQVFWFALADWTLQGRLVGGALIITVTAFVWWIMSRTARYTDEFVENVSGPGSRFRLRWVEVARATVYPGTVELRDGAGRAFRVHVRICDGYPELAAIMRDRLPARVLDAQPDARELLSQTASVLEGAPQ